MRIVDETPALFGILLVLAVTGCQSAAPSPAPAPQPSPQTTTASAVTVGSPIAPAATPTPQLTATTEAIATSAPPPPPTQAPPPPPPPAGGGNAAAGRTLFLSVGCSGCHGQQGQGDFGPRIARTSLSFEQVLQQVRTPRNLMQPFSPSDLSDQDVRNIYAFLQTLP